MAERWPYGVTNTVTRRRQAEERRAVEAAKPQTGHTVAEWKSMAEPDPETEPQKHASWKVYQSPAYDWSRSTLVTEPNQNAIADWQTKAKAVPRQVAAVMTETRKKLRAVERRTDLSVPDRQKLTALVRSDGQQRLGELAAEAKRASDALDSLIKRGLKPKAGDTASELRQQAAWNRALRILDRTPHDERSQKFESLVERAAKNDDGDLLSALWAEGPAFAEAEDWPDADKLRETLVHVAAPPDAARAYRAQQATKTGFFHVNTALGIADEELRGNPSGNLVPGWDGGDELYEIQDESPEEKHESEETRLRGLLSGH